MNVAILGIRGIPASHGGFETFAERLSLFLTRAGHTVVVYCQGSHSGSQTEDDWNGVQRIHIPTRLRGSAETIEFDWKSIGHATTTPPDVALVLGYNTAVFCARLRAQGIPFAINMDGIEWHRAKWGFAAKAWFWANEFFGCIFGERLIADHPAIAEHLSRHGFARGKIRVIPYGADNLSDSAAQDALQDALPPGVRSGQFFSVVARPEPENSILEIVSAFSKRPRGVRLLVVGAYDPNHNAYHRQVMKNASEEVMFVGAIYERPTLRAIRRGSLAYVHGHTVGGTNPSLVEALGAGSAVIAHDNRYNRWVAGGGALYFRGIDELDEHFARLQEDVTIVSALRSASYDRFCEQFQWDGILTTYVDLLSSISRSRS